jgi:hypothetical protein
MNDYIKIVRKTFNDFGFNVDMYNDEQVIKLYSDTMLGKKVALRIALAELKETLKQTFIGKLIYKILDALNNICTKLFG